MKRTLLLLTMLAAGMAVSVRAQIPLVYETENSEPLPSETTWGEEGRAVPLYELPDALEFSSGQRRVTTFADWAARRAEISAELQRFGIGRKPTVDASQVRAQMLGDTLVVCVSVNGRELTLRSAIHYPATGQPPYALMIGASHLSLPPAVFNGRPVALMTFHEDQVNTYSQWREHGDRGSHPFDLLYPELTANGAYSEWAWGLSRLIDGLQQLGSDVTRIDTRRIGVTGCSYAGKMALYCGAMDERVALTIAQEPGGGGAAAWRVSHTLDSLENIDRTDYHWFLESQRQHFIGDSVYRLPYDQHELVAMVCPRAFLMLGNPDFKWLADESAYVSMQAARRVWEHFGIADRFGYSIRGGHPHCQLPEQQYAEVEKFIDRFLLGRDVDTRQTAIAPDFEGSTDLTKWIPQLGRQPEEMEDARTAVNQMKIGWNLGNTLDATGRRDSVCITPIDWETSWGNPVTTRQLIHAFKERGFNVIRVPVTWGPHIDADGNVDRAWMRRVTQIVNYVMDEGMYCILNVHHDTGTHGWLNADPECYPDISRRFRRLWQQIAERFQPYGERLVFEAFNEMLDKDGHWDHTDAHNYTAINQLAQDFVDVVRATGGRNEYRNLIITTYSANGGKITLSHYQLPRDAHQGHLIGEVHFYDPQDFCFPENKPTQYTKAYQRQSKKVLQRIADHFDQLDVPVIIGEIAAFDKKNTPEREKFARLVASESKRRGMVLIWWMGLLDRKTLRWSEPTIVDALFDGLENN